MFVLVEGELLMPPLREQNIISANEGENREI